MNLYKAGEVGAFILFFCAAAVADTTNLFPAADTTLFEKSADNNLGATDRNITGTTVDGKRNRLLLRFDVSVIPANAVITSVTLSLDVVKAGGGPDSVFSLHRMLVGWGEGAGSGSAGSLATNGDVTWNKRVHPATAWGAPGAALGTDCSTAISASTTLGSSAVYTFDSTTDLVADVQSWIGAPGANFGWILICESEATAATARRIGSRESPGSEPALVVEYFVPTASQPPLISEVKIVGGGFQFSFTAAANQAYGIEYKADLTATNWLTLTNYPSQNTGQVIQFSTPATDSRRFFRVRGS